jgi:alanine dehydrogenase
VVKEDSKIGEHRVAIVPGNVTKLTKAGATVLVEKDAGLMSGFTDEQVGEIFQYSNYGTHKI